jgi:hypothetical protein
MTNFGFLKTINKNLFNIINDAEKLYRDGYFEQCISQTRRFGESICKDIAGVHCTPEMTFDDRLATLKDNAGNIQEKEFVEDLYFLKKQGNEAVHSSSVKQDGILALECLQRAFEVAINYSVYYAKSNPNILNMQYDIDLLITGEKSKKSLTEKYNEKKSVSHKPQKRKHANQSYVIKSKEKRSGLNLFNIVFCISFLISIFSLIFIYMLSK